MSWTRKCAIKVNESDPVSLLVLDPNHLRTQPIRSQLSSTAPLLTTTLKSFRPWPPPRPAGRSDCSVTPSAASTGVEIYEL